MRFFISSTFEDLKEFRKYTIEYLTNLTDKKTGNFAAMEYFVASENTSKEVCLAELEKSDIVIGIYGSRFGWIEKETGRSMTEIEFDRAIELGKPVLGFVTYQEQEPKQKEFIHKKVFAQGKNCGRFHTLHEYADVLDASLKTYFETLEGFSYDSIWRDINELKATIDKEIADGSLHMPLYEDGQENLAVNDIITSAEHLQELLPSIWELFYEKNSHMYGFEREKVTPAGWEMLFLGLPNLIKKITHAAAFLDLVLLQHKLLTEKWTEDLRKKVLEMRDRYIKTSANLYYSD